ncbi:serine/threonine-protein kinase [Nocardia tenerifensis]|uniref:non-specific serine/threonine protein kinase n=1 Tax=Nocardia tenerifensis TaxID=228006 RepID=A0A318K3W2_9NOCA|nr:serine/threonine-protein kinase [Nocardia tenerifensis]PXX66531.1 serine/threonine-protein kinase [Nocardia tenerifensis]
MAISPGTIVGGYRVQRVLGAGGMGTVYLAKHPSLPRMDALKVLSGELSNDHEFRARFEREANLAAGLDHPNIVAVYNRGEEDGRLWIAMQYVDGTDASAELTRDRHSMNPLRALRITTEVGKGLDYAHRKGLLHRDVKPANFLLSSSEGDEERVLLTDFGVAKSNDDTTELTQTGSFVATIAYAPPEQLVGGHLDHRADIYSLACAFFKLLTGRNPYPATQPALVMMGHLHEPPPSATAVDPGLPPAIDHVFAKAMAKDPTQRFNTCREFTDAAASALIPGYNPAPTSTSPTYPIQVFDPRPNTDPRVAFSGPQPLADAPARSRKRWVIGAGVGAVVVALAAGIGIWGLGGNDSPRTDTPLAASSTVAMSSPPSTEQPRGTNPAFRGKTITVVDVQRMVGSSKPVSIFLGGTAQSKFLESLGFVYNLAYVAQNGEPSPRAMKSAETLEAASDSYVLAVRTDEEAGGGGLRGLPYQVAGTRATVIPLDDPEAVAAFRNWTPASEQLLLEKLVPLLQKRVK